MIDSSHDFILLLLIGLNFIPARGIAYALIREGNIIYEGGFGHANDTMTKVSETVSLPTIVMPLP